MEINDPFPPEPADYSLDLPVPAQEVKYPLWADLSNDRQLELLTDEMVSRKTDEPVEIMLKRMGVDWEDYKRLAEHPDYVRTVKQKSLALRTTPHLPETFDQLGIDAANGDSSARKDLLQTIGSIAPDNATLVNGHLINLSDDEMKLELQKMIRQLDELEGK